MLLRRRRLEKDTAIQSRNDMAKIKEIPPFRAINTFAASQRLSSSSSFPNSARWRTRSSKRAHRGQKMLAPPSG